MAVVIVGVKLVCSGNPSGLWVIDRKRSMTFAQRTVRYRALYGGACNNFSPFRAERKQAR